MTTRHDRDTKRRCNTATSKAMRAHAAARQCPACERKSALRKVAMPDLTVFVCRWCRHEIAYPHG